LRGRLLAGPELAHVVHVLAISHGRKPKRNAGLRHDVEELILAVKTAAAVVANVFRVFQLVGLDHLQRYSLGLREIHGIAQMSARETGRICNDREHFRSQYTMRCVGQIGRICATGVGDHQPACTPQTGFERHALAFKSCGCGVFGHCVSTFAAVGKAEEQRRLGHRLRKLIERRHLSLRERRKLARDLHVFFKLRNVVAADDHCAYRVRQRELHGVAHGHYAWARRDCRAFP
jgi:signal transduction histidine kinase